MGESTLRWLAQLPLVIGSAAVVVVATTTAAVLSPAVRDGLGLGPSATGYEVGQRFELELGPSGNGSTLVILAKSTCAACQRAGSFVADLVAVAADAGVTPILVSTEYDHGAAVDFAQRLGLSPGSVRLVEAATLRADRVPTILLLDARGTIVQWWGAAAVAAHDPRIRSALLNPGHTARR